MSRYLPDTNIISNITKPLPAEALVRRMADQADEDLFISALTVAEIRKGILEKPPGKKRRDLERWFSGPAGPQALVWGRMMAEGTAAGRPRSAIDTMIAAVAEVKVCGCYGQCAGFRRGEGGESDAGKSQRIIRHP